MSSDYGFKISNKGEDARSTDVADILLNYRYPIAKIDPTMDNTFRTTTITFLTELAADTEVLLTSFPHGYDYAPQVWGLWDVTWGAGTLTPGDQNAYGAVTNSSGLPNVVLYYGVDDENINVYYYETSGGIGLSIIGTVANLTTYVFADDLQPQDYTT